MQRNLISMIRGLFARGESRTKTAASDKPNARVAILSMPSWAGRRVRHQVQVIDRKPDSATVWSPEYVDVKETVWIEDAGRAVRYSVDEYVATGGGYRLNLSITGDSRRSKERVPCNSPGDLEWVEGLTRVRCPVRVTNETTDGVQLTLSRPAPEIRSVRLQYNGTTKTGTVRYCVQIGASYLVGVEFV